GAPPDKSCIVSLGNGQYQIGDHMPVVVSYNEDLLLQAFLERGAMTRSALDNLIPGEHGAKCLKKLAEKHEGRFAPAIHLPGKKGAGGYRVAIRSAPPQSG